MRGTPEERFFAKVDRQGPFPDHTDPLISVMTRCWQWTAAVQKDGYGHFWDGQAMVLAHRFSYQIANGVIPEGMQSDHLCRNRLCVRPDHLEAVTQRQNMARGTGPSATALRTNHCQRGHSDWVEHQRKGKRYRVCRICLQRSRREVDARRNARRKFRTQLEKVAAAFDEIIEKESAA